jgi:tyrosyl-tRNA synthetase
MNFIDELRWRGIFQDMTPDLEDALTKGSLKGYIGFDPTAPSLTIGNYCQIMILNLFQRAGHIPYVLMGGATGLIGDPSGKDAERNMLDENVLSENLERQSLLMRKFLNFDHSSNAAIMVNNADFYKNMNVLSFLRDIGKHVTINYMLAKEAVQNRIGSGISFTEFSYQLIQAYDFLHLYQTEGVQLQMGGSDQWGNITAGTHLIGKKLDGASVHGLVTKLLTKADGKKFGKSEQGNIWVDPERTSAYQFYQFWLNATDEDVVRFNRFFTLKPHEEVEAMEQAQQKNPAFRVLQLSLAEEMTRRIHSDEAYQAALQVSKVLFDKSADANYIASLSEDVLQMLAREIPSFALDNIFSGGKSIGILDLFAGITSVCPSKAEVRRAIQANAISINKVKFTDPNAVISADSLLHNQYLVVENGKKNKFVLQFKN